MCVSPPWKNKRVRKFLCPRWMPTVASQCCLALKAKTSQFIMSVVLKIMDGLILGPEVLHWAQEMDGLSSGRDPSTQVAWQMRHWLLHIWDHVYVHKRQHFPSPRRKIKGNLQGLCSRILFMLFLEALEGTDLPLPCSDWTNSIWMAAGQTLNLLPRQ